ncbi:hypothetical protein M422DRAFT_64480 [Sphaerobolus stellatus SS14]|nr:hypothetical protein M422DRAFT_64480 [Sphaerobolus stellatus SS14]
MYAGEVGVPRLLKLLAKYDIKATWFVPGHSLETFPDQVAAVRDAGHELGLHGYSHENPQALNFSQQKEIFDHTFKLLTDFCGGVSPKGSVAPWWETSKDSIQLLLENGIEYDHSNMAHDCQAYYLRDEDIWYKIRYDQSPQTWMKPLRRGNDTGLVEIPANWYLEDMTPLMYMKNVPNSHGWVDTRVVEKIWKDTFTYYHQTEDDFIFPVTIHPDVSGYDLLNLTEWVLLIDCFDSRPHVLLMVESFIQWVNTHDDVHWVPMVEMSREFRRKNPHKPNAVMPKGYIPHEEVDNEETEWILDLDDVLLTSQLLMSKHFRNVADSSGLLPYHILSP